MLRSVLATLAAGLVVASTSPALATSPIAHVICAPTTDLHQRLTRQMGSSRSASGMRGPEQIMEVWTSAAGRWTLVVTYATGTSCIVAMGEDWATNDPHGAG
ncbi:MAG: hypothetical protein OIF47_00835 [Marinibacterium sp.]|nr:hypothetical protein [Marinibacterium sp.]